MKKRGSRHHADGSIGYSLDHVKVTVFGRNLTDKVYSTYQGSNAVGNFITFASPRTYGISLGYSF